MSKLIKNLGAGIDRNQREHGYWEIKWNDGSILYSGLFIHGKKYREHKYYNEFGTLTNCSFYHMGNLVYQTSKNKFIL